MCIQILLHIKYRRGGYRISEREGGGGGLSGYLLTTKMRHICACVRQFFSLYDPLLHMSVLRK